MVKKMLYNEKIDHFLAGQEMNILNPIKFGQFDGLSKDELYELADHSIGLRIALRSSGKIQDNLADELFDESQDLYLLDENQLKEKIDYHASQYQLEK